MTEPTAGTVVSSGPVRYLWLLWVLWLAFLIYPLNSLVSAHPSALRLALILLVVAVFAVLYSWNIWRNLHHLIAGEERGSPWLVIGILAAVALGLMLGDGNRWIELFIYVGVSMGPSLPVRQAVRALGAVVLLMLGLGLATGAGVGQSAQIALQSAVSGFAVIIVVRTVMLDRELRLARAEIARLAVSEERLRFARDLHDLLGHSLSLIALKSELVGKLIPVAPERAAAENRDVEMVARRSLAEVREAVAGYRRPTLSGELQSAREILTAAGVRVECTGEADSVPPAQEGVLAWAVREGVTNVIKHSRAEQCTIRLTRSGDEVTVEIIDDGKGHLAAEAPAQNGSGLSGLTERAAAVGGRCERSVRREGGFRLAVTVPVTSVAREQIGKQA